MKLGQIDHDYDLLGHFHICVGISLSHMESCHLREQLGKVTKITEALKLITVNLKMDTEQHIHQETKILPIKEHCLMKSKQYLLTGHQPDHPAYTLHKFSRPLPAMVVEII